MEGLYFVKCSCGATAISESTGNKKDMLYCHKCDPQKK